MVVELMGGVAASPPECRVPMPGPLRGRIHQRSGRSPGDLLAHLIAEGWANIVDHTGDSEVLVCGCQTLDCGTEETAKMGHYWAICDDVMVT